MMSKLYAIAGAIVAFLVALSLKLRGDVHKAEKRVAQHNQTAAEAQNKAIFEANKALAEAQEKGRKEVKEAHEKAKNGDYSSLDSDW